MSIVSSRFFKSDRVGYSVIMGSDQETQFSRRDFFTVMEVAAAEAIWVSLFPGGKLEYFTEEHIIYPKSGWLETSFRYRPDFFTLQNEGNRRYVVTMCQEHPILRNIVQKELKALLYDDAPAERPKLGDYFAHHVRMARKSLKKTFASEPSLDNAVHVAMYTMASVLHPYLESPEFGIETVFSVELPENTAEKEGLFIKAYTEKLPILYPASVDKCTDFRDWMNRCMGWDRAIHFTQHMFVAYMYIYSRLHGLPDWKRMHNGLRLVVAIPKSLQEEAALLSWLAGYAWEALETYEGTPDQLAHLVTGKPIVPAGFWDEMVELDLAANRLGARTGEALGFGGISPEYLDKVIATLNGAEITTVVQNVKKPSIIALPHSAGAVLFEPALTSP